MFIYSNIVPNVDVYWVVIRWACGSDHYMHRGLCLFYKHGNNSWRCYYVDWDIRQSYTWSSQNSSNTTWMYFQFYQNTYLSEKRGVYGKSYLFSIGFDIRESSRQWSYFIVLIRLFPLIDVQQRHVKNILLT